MARFDEDEDLYWDSDKPEVTEFSINIKNDRELEEQVTNFLMDAFNKILENENDYDQLERIGYDLDTLFNVSSLITPEKITISVSVPNVEDYDTNIYEEVTEHFEDEITGGMIMSYGYGNVQPIYEKGGSLDNRYDNYAQNIYSNQSERDAREGLISFARENGFDYSDVEKALQVYKYDTEENAWGEQYYTKKAIRGMISMIANEKYSKGGSVEKDYHNVPYWAYKGYNATNKNFSTLEDAKIELERLRKEPYYKNVPETLLIVNVPANDRMQTPRQYQILHLDKNYKRDKQGMLLSYSKGGSVETNQQDWYDFDKKMSLINCDIIKEYAIKLDNLVSEDTMLEDWVKMKLTRVEQNVADVKKSLEGWQKYEQYGQGGRIFKKQLLHIANYAEDLLNMIKSGSKLMSWQENKLAVSAEYIDGIYHHLDYEMGNRASKMGVAKANLGYIAMADTFSRVAPKSTAAIDERLSKQLNLMNRFNPYRDGGNVNSPNEQLIKQLEVYRKYAPMDFGAKARYDAANRSFQRKMGMTYEEYLSQQSPMMESMPKMSKQQIYERLSDINRKIQTLEQNAEDLNWTEMGGYEAESEQIYNRIEQLKQERNELKLELESDIDYEQPYQSSFYHKFGNENAKLLSFNLSSLEPVEQNWYQEFYEKFKDKAYALQLLINTVEGDYTQLSPQLARIAEEQKPSVEWSGEEPIIGIARYGGRVGRKKRAKSTYNRGSAWTIDRKKFNKNEDWEIPMADRKSKKGSGFLGLF